MKKIVLMVLNNVVNLTPGTQLGTNPGNLGEEAYSLLHASTWTATIALHTVDPAIVWKNAMETFCNMPSVGTDVFAHCLHGLGHGALFAAAAAGDDLNAQILDNPCGRAGDFERSIVLNQNILKTALPICGGGPTMEYQYMCASGLYMTYWTSLMFRRYFRTSLNSKKTVDYVGTCSQLPWPAACCELWCFTAWRATEWDSETLGPAQLTLYLHLATDRWTFRYATAPEIRQFWENNPCGSAEDNAFLSPVQRRGCIWGVATNWYLPFDSDLSQESSSTAGGTLNAFCDEFTERPETGKSALLSLHRNRDHSAWKKVCLCLARRVSSTAVSHALQ